MPTLYEILGVNATATQEEVRKAYKKRALQTHPDRLPQGATAADKEKAEDEFRKVNAAYEVLTDPSNRKLYDRHGVWPPPETTQSDARPRPRHRNTYDQSFHSPPPMQDPFAGFFDRQNFGFGTSAFPHHQHHHHMPFFHDPFELFNSMFSELDPIFTEDPFFNPRGFRRHGGVGVGPSPFAPLMLGRMHSLGLPSYDAQFGRPEVLNSRTFSSSYRSATEPDGNSRWISESRMSRTVNGRTESVEKRRDHSGNEHVWYTGPDGTRRHTVNGVEQTRSSLPPPSRQPPLPPPPPHHQVPPPVPPKSHHQPPPQQQALPPPPVYPTQNYFSPPPQSRQRYEAAPIPPVAPQTRGYDSYEPARGYDHPNIYDRPNNQNVYEPPHVPPPPPPAMETHDDHSARKRWFKRPW